MLEEPESTLAGFPYIPVAAHEAAVALVCHAIDSGERRLVIVAGAGLGKTTVLDRVVNRLHSPLRRIARVAAPPTKLELWSVLADRLHPAGGRRGSTDTVHAWTRIVEALRLCRLQEQAVVIAVDDLQMLPDWRWLGNLASFDPHPEACISIVGTRLSQSKPNAERFGHPDALVVRIPPLTRSEAVEYLVAKFKRGEIGTIPFDAMGLTRLHALARGVPRVLNRLSSLASLEAGRLERSSITADLIDHLAGAMLAA